VECCEAGRLLATVQSTCSSRDPSRDDGRQTQRESDDVDRSCAVVRSVCCLAEHRQVRCRRGVSYGLAVSRWDQQYHHHHYQQQQQQHVDDDDCQHLSDDAKVQDMQQSSNTSFTTDVAYCIMTHGHIIRLTWSQGWQSLHARVNSRTDFHTITALYTLKIHSNISPTTPINFTRVKSVKFGLHFRPQSPLSRRNFTKRSNRSQIYNKFVECR